MPEITYPKDFEEALENKVTWPGGYGPGYFVTLDSGTICFDCALKNKQLMIDSFVDRDAQWNPFFYELNWENPDLYCDNCSQKIDPEYTN